MSDEQKSWSARLSRRMLLQGAASAAGAATILAASAKQSGSVVKISQKAVNYQDHPDGDKRCDKCAQFQPPSACKMVDGAISPHGSCRIFVPNRQALQRSSRVSSTA
jgi:hypothetical protein